MKAFRLILINTTVFAVLAALCLGLWEAFLVYRKASQPGAASTLRVDTDNGWDSIPETAAVGGPEGGTRVAFIGDSFTQGTLWTGEAVGRLNAASKPVRGISLGVAGYGTIQATNKLRKNFDALSPKVVVLLFFAWNDMRDNYPWPGIYYNAQTRYRPYFEDPADPKSLARPSAFHTGMSRSLVYQQYLYPVLALGDEKLMGSMSVDEISRKRIRAYSGYADTRMWDPFYRTDKANSDYVRQAWTATRSALKELKQLVEVEHSSKLLVIGIDNAFTVDDDVRAEWVKDTRNFDPDLPLNTLGKVLGELGIPYVNALPELRALRARVGRKVYNGPDGNIAGHFEKDADLLVGRLAADAILRSGAL